VTGWFCKGLSEEFFKFENHLKIPMSNLIRSFLLIRLLLSSVRLKGKLCSKYSSVVLGLTGIVLVRTEIINSQKRDCFLPKEQPLCMTVSYLLTLVKGMIYCLLSILRTVANGEAASISKCRTKLASNCLIYQLKITQRDSRYRLRSLLEHSFRVRETDVPGILVC
jgi:hypothetical protein